MSKDWISFERDMCKILYTLGYWAHRISKDERGAQPFDIIALKRGSIFALDCKTCSKPRFEIKRAEINQCLAFDALLKRTDAVCGFVCLYDDDIYLVPFEMVRSNIDNASIRLTQDLIWISSVSSLGCLNES